MTPMQGTKLTKAGMPPGSLVYVGDHGEGPVKVCVYQFDEKQVDEFELDPSERLELSWDKTKTTWVDVQGIHNVGILKEVGRLFHVHDLVLEDILNTRQRPKFEDYDDHNFFTLKSPERSADGQLGFEHLSIVLGDYFVLSFQENQNDKFKVIKERIRKKKGRVRNNRADYLAYVMLDSVVDQYLVVQESLSDHVVELESGLLGSDTISNEVMNQINQCKKENMIVRKTIRPLLEVFDPADITETPLISEATTMYFRDIQDHVKHLVEVNESNRDMIASMFDLHLANLSHKLNEVMKVLAVISTIFIPLTFLAGIYGMNFKNMPELDWPWAYPTLLGIMGVLVIGMVFFFRKRDWF